MDNEKVNLEEMTPQETATYEGDLMNAILRAAEFKTDESEYRRIQIKRNDKVLFKFLIRPLTEEDLSKCRKKNTRTKQGRFGIDREKLDGARYRSQIIYEATVPDDSTGGVKIWDYKREVIWPKLNVASGVDAIDAILKAGEKDMVVEAIEHISGFQNDDNDVIEDIKN